MTRDPSVEFEAQSGRLFAVAYRMLGSRSDAEDMLQETYLRWHGADRPSIEDPRSWMTTVITRLCIDRLRERRKMRSDYPGDWLPEPLDLEAEAPNRDAELAEDLSIAFLIMMERLAPTERAAFLLREVFGYSYGEMARILGKGEAACRQVVRRARERVRLGEARFSLPESDRRDMVERFIDALVRIDEEALLGLLATDVSWRADGGGKVPAVSRTVRGPRAVSRLALGLARRFRGSVRYQPKKVNGQWEVVVHYGGRVVSVLAVETDGKTIHGFYNVLNPDKLRDFLNGRH